MLQKGQVFNNRYKFISTLGQGGFGAVYKVWDDNLQRHCAIKENLQVSPEAQKQFKREAIMLANLNHPHLVRVTDYFFIADRGQYLVMDFVDGNNLQTILTDNGGPLPAEQALAWIRQVCDALIYIHGQNPPIIHRDIKPANIRVTPQGNAVLVDFGLAKTFDAGMKTSMGARGLTPHFAAPEQYGMGGTDAQSDIYSLGVTLYCLLTYSVPPDSVEIMVGNADPPSPAKAIHSNISDSVSDALQRAMQIRRTERYKSVTDFKNALSTSQVVQIVNPAYKTPSQVSASTNKFALFNMEFVRVPAGKFLMGSNDHSDNEKPQHTVELSEYLIGKYPIINLEYQAFVRDAKYKAPDFWKNDQFPAGQGNHPVSGVSWNDANAFCKWLSGKTGKQHRLPTEAEWEKAARGTDGREYPWGDVFDPKKVNGLDSEEVDSTNVGNFSPQGDSPYGCVDMVGNVYEWVNDWYGSTYYKSSPSSNPLGPDSGEYRVYRGSSTKGRSDFTRCAHRRGLYPYVRYLSHGFRVIVSSVPSTLPPSVIKIDKSDSQNILTYDTKLTLSNGMEFMRVPAGKFLMGKLNNNNEYSKQHTVDIPYDFWMARLLVTNEFYNSFVKAITIDYRENGWKKKTNHPVDGWEKKKDHPVTCMYDFYDVIEYYRWLNNLFKSEIPSGLVLRLPTEAEWEKSARGTDAREFPWGNVFDKNKCHANIHQYMIRDTAPVGSYSPRGDSPYGCADMSGNVFEWTCSLSRPYPFNVENLIEENSELVQRSCSWEDYEEDDARVSRRKRYWPPDGTSKYTGFRLVIAPPPSKLIELAEKSLPIRIKPSEVLKQNIINNDYIDDGEEYDPHADHLGQWIDGRWSSYDDDDD